MRINIATSVIGIWTLVIVLGIGLTQIEDSQCSVGMGFKGGFCEKCH